MRSIILLFSLALVSGQIAIAQDNPGESVRVARIIETNRLAITRPAGLAYTPERNAFLLLGVANNESSAAGVPNIFVIDEYEDLIAKLKSPSVNVESSRMVFDGVRGCLLVLDTAVDQLIVTVARLGQGALNLAGRSTRVDAAQLGVLQPRALALDSTSGRLWLLDGGTPSLVSVMVNKGCRVDTRSASTLDLAAAGLPGDVNTLALEPGSGHLFLASPKEQKLYETTRTAEPVATWDLSGVDLGAPQDTVFAFSGDRTDDPSQMSLYVADAGGTGKIVELSIPRTTPIAQSGLQFGLEAGVTNEVARLQRTIDTSQWSPPSPDPADIVYRPNKPGPLTVSDSEVDEMPLYAGVNLFEIGLSGTVERTWTTLSPNLITKEPTGLAYGSNDLLYISDDDWDSIYVVNSDGVTVGSFSTRTFDSTDMEDLTFDPTDGPHGALYGVDGLNAEVYKLTPGADGIFNGVPPEGDDEVSHFDTAGLGITDPEGIAFNAQHGTLVLVGHDIKNNMIEVTPSGAIDREIDICAASALAPSGIDLAPCSDLSGFMCYYVTDRGVDNDYDASENDGKIYEFSLRPPTPGNRPPTVDAGPDRTITWPNGVILDGSVEDDGVPSPALGITWGKTSGPGTVSFTAPNAEDTAASFSSAGVYVLQLTADDGERIAIDDVTITVDAQGDPVNTLDVRVAASTDDAEEAAGGQMYLTSTDLELVNDGSDQTVGMRFNGVNVPRAAMISHAYVQFKVDEVHAAATAVTIKGQNVDNAPTFTSTAGDISSRTTTAAGVAWNPVPLWPTVGEAGPDQRTPDIASVIQEIVNRSGWASGNSLAIIITGTGRRTAEAFNGDPSGAPLLHVEYSMPGGNPPPPVEPTTTIRQDILGRTITAPQRISGTASAAAGVAYVWSAVHDLDRNLWWTGSTWQTGYTRFQVQPASPGAPKTSWSYTFSPGRSGTYQAFGRATDLQGGYDPKDKQVWFRMCAGPT